MKRLLGALVAFMLMAGVFASPAAAAPADRDAGAFQLVPTLTDPGGGQLPNSQGGGTASIVRNDAGISIQVRSTGLKAGHAYTAWFLVFDNGFGNGPPIVVNLGGNIVGASGNSTISGRLAAGDVPDVNGEDVLNDGGDGVFDNPRGADVFVHVIDHGPADDIAPGDIPINIHTILGDISFAQEWFFAG